jgi:predicted acetyltransferase
MPVPELVRPTTAVRGSYLAGERAMAAEEGEEPYWLPEAAADFAAFVAERAVTRRLREVPATELWFVDGPGYLGTVMVRHKLTAALRRQGGHIGYHVVPGHRRRGHATAMLAAACAFCRADGMTKVLLTCAEGNVGSRRVIEASGGDLEQVRLGTCRYWIRL